MTTHSAEVADPVDTEESDARPTFLHSLTGQTPWWVVSVLLHALVITLAGLVSLAIELPKSEDTIVMTIPLDPRPELQPVMEKKRDASTLASDRDTPPIDLSSTVPSDITVLDDMNKFVKGDHWELNTPQLPDQHTLPGSEKGHAVWTDPADIDGNPGGGGKDGDSFGDMVGVGGQTSRGTGGGDGGGDGPGFGVDKGAGKTPFGHGRVGGRINMALRHGGGHHTEFGVNQALRWLAYHQDADGHWDTVKFGSAQKTDTAMTGMALLAFLGAGHSEKIGEYKDNVKRAVGWLKSKQQPSGLIFDSSDAGAHRGIGYPTAIATLAMVEAAGMGNIPETRSAAQKAIDYCVQHQCGDGSDKLGWRYSSKQPGDTSVTGWFVMALKSAKIAHLNVDPSAIARALRFIDTVEIKDAGGDQGYGGVSHYGYQPGNEHASSTHRLSAIGNLVKIFMGEHVNNVTPSVEWFVNKGGVPSWGANGESVDMYYWYYGSLCTFQCDGDVWNRWNKGMVKALTENQCTAGDDKGSWPIVGEFSSEWGRVGQTALGCLSLEVYYRYDQLHMK